MAGHCLHPNDVRPNPPLGTYYYVPHDHTGERIGPHLHMLAAYRFPPTAHFVPGMSTAYRTLYPTFQPDSYIGPVVGIDHSDRSTAVLINNHWVIVWSSQPEPQPGGPPFLLGTHHIRPVSAAHFAPSWSHPAHEPWDHPFQDLWLYTPDLGISHLAAPGRYSPPRFLLTGAAWLRLFQVRDLIRRNADEGSLWVYHYRQALARMLHHFLDYPPLANGPFPGTGLAFIQQIDVVPRGRIQNLLRTWIRARREVRADERRRLIYADELLPPLILSLAHAVQFIAECL